MQGIRQGCHVQGQQCHARSHARRRLQPAAASVKDLWSYQGSHVQEVNLDMMKFMHRLSYGHRNRRSVLVVAYDPLDPACRQIEFEIERLATGLHDYPQVLVSKLNVRGPGNTSTRMTEAHTTTAQFLEGALDVKQLPAILLYPEGAPGFMKYQALEGLTAEALLTSLNRCQQTILPDRAPMQLQGPLQGSTAGSTHAVSASQQPTPKRGWFLSRLWRRRASSTQTTAASPAQPAIASTAATPDAGGMADSSSTAAITAAGQMHQAKAADTQVNSQTAVAAQTSPAWSVSHNKYWTSQKVWFWGFIGVISVGMVVWEKWLGPYLELRALMARQEARAAGGAADIDEETNLDDLFRLYTLKQQQQQQEPQQQEGPVGKLQDVRPPAS